MSENVPILNGKAAEYNVAILEVLYTKGPQESAWYLAKEIVEKLKIKSNDPIRNTYSVLIRKEGRLETLEKLDYIGEDKERKIWIAYKGIIALLIHNPGILNKINPDMVLQLDKLNKIAADNIPDIHKGDYGLKLEGLGTAVRESKIIPKINSVEGYRKVSKIVAELTKEGIINLDLIKTPTLQHIIGEELKKSGWVPNSITLD